MSEQIIANAVKITLATFRDEASGYTAQEIIKKLMATRCRVQEVRAALKELEGYLETEPDIQADIGRMEKLIQAMETQA